jgi:hypothetical protein
MPDNLAFYRNDNGGWTEVHSNGRRYRFAQSAETADYIELRCDMGRDLRIRLSANGSELQQNKSEWARFYPGTWLSEADFRTWAAAMKITP